ncbi:MAG: D-alanyl-D-alanine carboxypeptidase [Candidatus Eisenbacteria bacterium]|uniref:D-alanyl-D-alanine carboxypeptidase n=1 Tax=Eiseniibacteriota bacterium TaxID=2212470 RepID=A0A849SGN3_UNCEI|nr:D-alanyl-D-alanine carboxypeptidase [Candidatus Eisenbacteria bacterium]
MLVRAPRALFALVLAIALIGHGLALSVRPAAAADSSTRRSSSVRARSTAPKRTVARKKARPAPPGGVWSRQAVLIDPESGEVLFSKNSREVVPIASLSKLMTAIVFLEDKPDLDRTVVVTREDWRGAGKTHLDVGERVRLGDLLHMSLMCSDNCATRVLARESGLEGEDFIVRMNRRALEMGLQRTRFVEPTGLSERNVASAEDVARLLVTAARIPTVREIMTTRVHQFRTARKPHSVPNTNRLLYGRLEVRGGKTGYISEAGYCFATWVRSQGRDLVAVVLGAPTPATRFADVVRLVRRSAPGLAANRG